MVALQTLEADFGESHFGQAVLGDVRRVRALVNLANQVATRPGYSLPNQVDDAAAYESMLGLVAAEPVTHAAVVQTHVARTCALVRTHPGTVLILHDTTELDYTTHTALKKLGPIGDGNGRGYECHNSLAVVGDTGEVLGLAHQILHTRVEVPAGEGVAAKRDRDTRESLLWVNGVAAVAQRCAPHPAGGPEHREVDVFDRGGDTFENLDAEVRARRTFVGRSNHNRQVFCGHDDTATESCLHTHARSRPEQGRRTVEVPSRAATATAPAQPARTATLAVSFAPVQVRAPRVRRGRHGKTPLTLWVVRAWEVDAPPDVEPLEWILVTNHPVETFADACQVIDWYKKRWIIEDYHKAMKTGCRIEKPQFRSEARLEPMIALLSVVATLLLRLRDLSRQADAKVTLATEVVPEAYVGVLSVALKQGRRVDMSVWEFFLGLAQLGGYGYFRKDNPPGFVVLWRGWAQLHTQLRYALAVGAETLPATDPVVRAARGSDGGAADQPQGPDG